MGDFFKKPTYRSEDFLEFVRSKECCSCGRAPKNIPHHRGGGVSLKGTDLSCVPLCHEEHQELHTVGVDTFMDRNNIDLDIVNMAVLREYIQTLELELKNIKAGMNEKEK